MLKIALILTKGNQFIMQSNRFSKFKKTIHLITAMLLLSFLFITCCDDDDCVVPECNVSLGNGSVVTVTSNVSGGQGTQITPDIIDSSDITDQSAVVKFTVLKIGRCHQVVGYGHAWSSSSATPRIGIDDFVDYEDNINFNDEVVTILNGLSSNTTYWVRSWIAIEKQDCTRERVIFYNDNISEFTTL